MFESNGKVTEVRLEAYGILGSAKTTKIFREYNVIALTENPKELLVEKKTWGTTTDMFKIKKEKVNIDWLLPTKITVSYNDGTKAIYDVVIDEIDQAWKRLRKAVIDMVINRGDMVINQKVDTKTYKRYDVEHMNILVSLTGIKDDTKNIAYLKVKLKYVTYYPDSNDIIIMITNDDPYAGEKGHFPVFPEILIGMNFAMTGLHKGSSSLLVGIDRKGQCYIKQRLLEMVGKEIESKDEIKQDDTWADEENYLRAMGMCGYHHALVKRGPKKLMFLEGFLNESKKEA